MQLTIKRETQVYDGLGMYLGPEVSTVATVEIDERTVYEWELMGMDKITCEVSVNEKLNLAIGDYVEYGANNARYTIKEAPEMVKNSREAFDYSITFHGQPYELYKKQLRDEGRSRFSYSGTPLELLGLIVDNMQELDVSWAVGDVAEITEVKTFTFSEQSCRTALTQVAEAFELEYYFEQGEVDEVPYKKIHLVEEVGSTQALNFLYGKSAGLYGLTRVPHDQPFATRWYGYGGTKNLPVTYRDNLGRLTFDSSPVEQNLTTYGIQEDSVTFEDIYPRRTAEVETTPSITEITDSTIDFDLNDAYLVEGSARIVFKTGALGGNEFIITSYDHGTKTIRFSINEDENGYQLPNDTVKAAIGDDYTLVGIEMPASYVTAAEAELQAAVEAHAAANSAPKVSYELLLNEKYVKANTLAGQLVPGDRVRVIDADLGVDDDLRVRYVSWPLVNANQIEVTISEDEIYTWEDRMVKEVKTNRADLDETAAVALYARNITDEVRRAAVLEQFNKTYVGDLCVLTGAFVAGNPVSGAVAGVNGAGTDADSIRFWAGSDYDNKETAPFRVYQNGEAFASGLEIAEGCNLSIFKVLANGLGILEAGSEVYYQSILSNDGLGMHSEGYNLVGFNFKNWSGAASLVNIKACVQGLVELGTAVDGSNVVAGVAGFISEQMSNLATYEMLYGGSRYKYGGLFSSIKNLGAEAGALRMGSTSAADETFTANDHTLIAQGSCTGVQLVSAPDHGTHAWIKNYTGTGSFPLKALGTDVIVRPDNTTTTTHNIDGNDVVHLVYDATGNRWFVMQES